MNNRNIKNKMKSVWKMMLFVTILLLGIVSMVSNVRAANFDNVKSIPTLDKGQSFIAGEKEITYNPLWEKYLPIEIKNWFGLGEILFSGVIDSNTETCGLDCSSEMSLYLANKGSLIDDVKFYTIDKDESMIEEPIINYQFYIKTGESSKTTDEYEWFCEETGKVELNGTKEKTCSKIKTGTHIETTPVWKEYNLGEELEEGTYEIKLEGKKIPSKTVDWIISAQGVELSEWATWGTGFTYNVMKHNLTVAGIEHMNYYAGIVIIPNVDFNISQIYTDVQGPNINSCTVGTSWKSDVFGIASGGYTNGTQIANPQIYINKSTTPLVYITCLGGTSYQSTDRVLANNSIFNWSKRMDQTGGEGPAGYNSVLGINVSQIFNDYITLNSPVNNFRSPTTNVTFNCSAYISSGGNLTNISLWTNATALQTTNFTGITSITTTFTQNFSDGTYLWNCQGCSSDGGCGFFSNNQTLNIDANSPIINAQVTNINLTTENLTYTITDINLSSCWYNYNNTNKTLNCVSGVQDSTTFILTEQQYLTVYANDSVNSISYQLISWSNNILENSQTYNATTYETLTENYILNLSANGSQSVTADLVYNGISYPATKTGDNYEMLFNKNLDIPLTASQQNITFYWDVLYGSTHINSTSKIQQVNPIVLTICNSTYPIAYLNFSFADETTAAKINASVDLATFSYWLGGGTVTKSYIFTNLTENYNSAYCFSPSDRTATIDLSFKYSKTGYPLRTFSYDNQALTNTTTNKLLYLLASTGGIYSAIRTASSSGAAITGVTITYERQIGGVWTMLGQEVTGSDGIATLWLDPNYEYRLTATATGYTSVQVIITPSQSQYTITMGSSSGTGTYVSEIAGVKWNVNPSPGTLNAKVNQVFNVTVTSSENSLENCKFELLNASNTAQVLATTTSITNSSYCFLTITYTTVKNQNLFGRLSLDTTNSTGFVIVNSDFKWTIFDLNNTKGWTTITSFFTDLTTLSEFGEGNEAEFNRIVFFFLIVTILIGAFIFFTGVELSNPGVSLIIIWGIVLVASISGFLTYTTGSTRPIATAFRQYGFFFIFTLFSAGYWLSMLRRTGE